MVNKKCKSTAGWGLFLPGILFLMLCALPATAKIAVDFDPNLDFSKYKTFTYIGGEELLNRQQLNPDLLKNRIHRAVARELTSKGLLEVSLEENPDLIVRYSIESKQESGVGFGSSWATYGTYWTGHWTAMYTIMHTHNANEGTLGVELIDARSHNLAWRMFAVEKIHNADTDKIWKIADESMKKAFKSYQPSTKDIAAKKEQWVKDDAAKKSTNP